MRRVVILHKTSKFKFDLTSIARPEVHTLHLVTLAEGGVQVPEGSTKAITSTATVPLWQLNELKAAVGDLVDRFPSDEIHLVTHDEYSMMFAAQIRETFDLSGPRVEQVLRFTDKPTMKTVLEHAGIAIPRWVRLSEWRDREPDDTLAEEILARTGAPAFAKEVAGYPSVFAHGMLSMGMTGKVLTDWVGDGRLLSYGVRFVKQVWPGDRLTATAEITAIDDGGDGPVAQFAVTTKNDDGVVVLTGTASARLDP